MSTFSLVLPGHEALHFPVLAFLIEHRATGARVMFDLGVRKDKENAAPAVVHAFEAGVSMPVDRDIVEQLVDVDARKRPPQSLKAIRRHVEVPRFDGSSTFAEDPKNTLLESDLAYAPFPLNSRQFIDCGQRPDTDRRFKAFDYFGDGRFITSPRRVTTTSFVFLGGDACHHAGMLRPTGKLDRHIPCPGELLAATRRSVSVTHFPTIDPI
ncbi:hypothetical protein DFH06DRAFT_1319569 [Mycena polygramma]|nr:hypothetical protein DFH06DRAFT_1319569 [Mycena polygramma]